jgi:hypothetical protein
MANLTVASSRSQEIEDAASIQPHLLTRQDISGQSESAYYIRFVGNAAFDEAAAADHETAGAGYRPHSAPEQTLPEVCQ